MPAGTLAGTLLGVDVALGAGMVGFIFCFGGGSGVLVCLAGGVSSSFIGLRRMLSEKHRSRGKLEKGELKTNFCTLNGLKSFHKTKR